MRTHLLDRIIKTITEALPAIVWDKDGTAGIPFHLRDGHVASLLVGLGIKVVIDVLDPDSLVLMSSIGIFREA